MIHLITIAIVLNAVTSAFPQLENDSVIVETEQGKLRGRIDFNYWNEPFFSFEGIPYARPPIGELRFKAPQPPLPWTDEIRDALNSGPACVQLNGRGSEDCLILNIHSKMINETTISEELRPVMVWIHGGAFKMGSVTNDLFGPDFLVHENIVLVKIQYRLNVLGFLSLEDDEVEVSGNAGLKDQVMALKWIQKNIENFGGDPNKVTIFGESAGGASAHLLYLSPMTKGLFHRVIAQSGCGLNTFAASQVIPQEKYFKLVGCDCNNSKELLECLQKVPVDTLLKIQFQFYNTKHSRFCAVIENSTKEETFLSENIEKTIKDGNLSPIPFMAGYVPNESAFLYLYGFGIEVGSDPLKQDLIPEMFDTDLDPDKAKKYSDKIKEFYFKNRNSTQEIFEGYLEYATDDMIIERLYKTVKWQAEKSTAPVYYYKFNYDTSLNQRLKMFPQNYITHTDDVNYLFTSKQTPKNLTNTSVEMQAVKRMIKIWARFADTGNPNPLEFGDEQFTDTVVEWKPVAPDHFYYLIIQPNLELSENPEAERMQFWEDFYKDLNLNS